VFGQVHRPRRQPRRSRPFARRGVDRGPDQMRILRSAVARIAAAGVVEPTASMAAPGRLAVLVPRARVNL
jgi:hypothetical protein